MNFQRIIITIILPVLIASVVIQPYEALAQKEVAAVILKNVPPLSFVDSNTGKHTGFAVEFLDAIALKTGLKIKYLEVNDWAEIDKALKNGSADICPVISESPKRHDYLNFTEPVETTSLNISVRSSTSDINNLLDLDGRKTGVVNGSHAWMFLKDNRDIRLVQFDSIQVAILELLSGRIDALIAPERIVSGITQAAGVEGQIKIISKPITEFKRSVGVRKGDHALYELINGSVATFVHTPEYQVIYSRWYGKIPSYWTARRVGYTMGSVFAALLLLIAVIRYRTMLKVNRRIKENEQRFRGIFDQTTQLVGLLNPDGFLLEVNQTALDMVGVTIEQVRNLPFPECPWWAHNNELKASIVKAIEEARSGVLVRLPVTHLSKEGELRHIDFSIKPVFDDSGKLCLLIPEGRDVTERVMAETRLHEQAIQLEQEIAERQHAQEELNSINESLEARVSCAIKELREKDSLLMQQSRQAAMGELLTNISHQWRQPLNNIAVYIQNMQYLSKKKELTEEELDNDIAMVMDILKQMSRTIDSFRKLFQEDRIRAEFPLSQTVEQCLNLVNSAFDSGNIRIRTFCNDDVRVIGFPNEYAQALMNILYNARDVLLERQVANPLIDISVKKEGAVSVLSVVDNGGGIAEDILPHIFEPYFSTKGAAQGTGIGLYMAKTMIEKHMGGRLSARNVDNGAEFRIEL